MIYRELSSPKHQFSHRPVSSITLFLRRTPQNLAIFSLFSSASSNSPPDSALVLLGLGAIGILLTGAAVEVFGG